MFNFIYKLTDYLRYREAVQKAEEAHAKSGHRFYVMPTIFDPTLKKPFLLVIDRENFRRLRMKHYINQNATTRDLFSECFYHTGYANGTGKISDIARKKRLISYYSYCETFRQLKKLTRKNKKEGQPQ